MTLQVAVRQQNSRRGWLPGHRLTEATKIVEVKVTLRRSMRALSTVCLLLSALVCKAQITVWIVRPATAADRAIQRTQKDLQEIQQYRETTSGSFGTSASETGQTAGSYGKTASDEGRPASEVGQTAGSYGQTAGSLPSNVTSQTAGSYGQTAGSFGQTASDFHGTPTQVSRSPDATASRDSKGARWTSFLTSMHGPSLKVLEVDGLELQARLAAAAGKATYPDVLLSDAMPDWWPAAAPELVVKRLMSGEKAKVFPEEDATASAPLPLDRPYAKAYGLVNAPHSAYARVFLEWWYQQKYFDQTAMILAWNSPPEELAGHRAVLAALSGEPLGSLADPTMASFDSARARALALGLAPDEVPPDLEAHVIVEKVQSNGRFAVVRLHAALVSRKAYGELYPLVLVHVDEHGQWKVLQLSLSMNSADAMKAFSVLAEYAGQGLRAGTMITAPVPASPESGDRRLAGNGLRVAWDERIEDGLMLVEWQRGPEGQRAASALMLVSEATDRARMEAPAPFADVTGPVRWRVWALGRGGTARQSDWRTVEMTR